MEYQIRNFQYFVWSGGDLIVEGHVHNLDVCNWLLDAHPTEANGMGGRQVPVDGSQGHTFDHHTVEFTYPNGVKLFSQSRYIPGCWGFVAEIVHGTKGQATLDRLGRRAERRFTGRPPGNTAADSRTLGPRSRPTWSRQSAATRSTMKAGTVPRAVSRACWGGWRRIRARWCAGTRPWPRAPTSCPKSSTWPPRRGFCPTPRAITPRPCPA